MIINEEQKRQQFTRMGYINVTGLTCLSYGREEMRFKIPCVIDHPNQKHISGEDFIFLLLENGQTWFKKVDLNIARRCSLYYMEGTRIVAMDNHNPVNTQGTVLAYPFDFDGFELQKRKLDPDCIIEKSTDVVSSSEIMTKIYATVTESCKDFLNYLFSKDENDLKQFPNKDFLQSFGSDLVQDVPVPNDQLRNLYMLVVLQAQKDAKFPYNLSWSEFYSLMTIPKPPRRYKGYGKQHSAVEVATEST